MWRSTGRCSASINSGHKRENKGPFVKMFHSRGAQQLQKTKTNFMTAVDSPLQLKLKDIIINNNNVSHTKTVAVYRQAFHTEAEKGIMNNAVTSLGMKGVKKQSRILRSENTSCPSTVSTISFMLFRRNLMAG